MDKFKIGLLIGLKLCLMILAGIIYGCMGMSFPVLIFMCFVTVILLTITFDRWVLPRV